MVSDTPREEPVTTGATEAAPPSEPSTPGAIEPAADGQTSASPEAAAAEAQADGNGTAPPAAEPSAEAPAARTKPERPRNPRAASLYRALRSGRSVSGVVEKVIKGGYEIRLSKTRAFCPHSQIDLHREDQPERHVGQTYGFRVTQIRRGGGDVVVSRRHVLEANRHEEAQAVRATLIEGAVTQGRIAGMAEFGAFVDLGAGVMGLVHVTELSHGRVTKVADAVKVGETVRVKILKIDDSKGRVSLSIRQATEDPWSRVAETFRPGQVYPGDVSRVADFGAFVTLAPGVEGLAPFSELPPSPTGWRDVLESGEQKQWLVLSVDPAQHRISVIPPVEGYEGETPVPVVGAKLRGTVQRHERFGVFVWLGPGRVALMPNAWTGVKRGEDMVRRLPIGDPVEIEVVEVSDDGRRIRVAREGAQVTRPGRDAKRPSRGDRAPREKRGAEAASPSVPDSPFGTLLADKLKAALDRPDPS